MTCLILFTLCVVNKTPVLEFCLHMCSCGTLLVDMSVPSNSISPPSPRTHTCVQWGNTPLLIAAAKGHAEVAHFLLDNGSNVHEQNDVSRLKRILSACDI